MQTVECLKSIYAIVIVKVATPENQYPNSQLAVELKFANHLIVAVNVKLNVNFLPLVLYFEIVRFAN